MQCNFANEYRYNTVSFLQSTHNTHTRITLVYFEFKVCPTFRLASLAVKQPWRLWLHYNDVIMGAIASQITSLTIVYSIVYSGADQRKHQSSASLVFMRGIHRRPVNSPHKWPVTQKIFPFDDVIMYTTVQPKIAQSTTKHCAPISLYITE